MKANGEEIKTIQELLRHSNYKVTADVYIQAMTSEARKPRLNTQGPRWVPVITNSTTTASSASCMVYSRKDRRRLDGVS